MSARKSSKQSDSLAGWAVGLLREMYVSFWVWGNAHKEKTLSAKCLSEFGFPTPVDEVQKNQMSISAERHLVELATAVKETQEQLDWLENRFPQSQEHLDDVLSDRPIILERLTDRKNRLTSAHEVAVKVGLSVKEDSLDYFTIAGSGLTSFSRSEETPEEIDSFPLDQTVSES